MNISACFDSTLHSALLTSQWCVILRNVQSELHFLIRLHQSGTGAHIESSLIEHLQSIRLSNQGRLIALCCSNRVIVRIPNGLRGRARNCCDRICVFVGRAVCLQCQRRGVGKDRGEVPSERDVDARSDLVVRGIGGLHGLSDGNTTGSRR